MNQSIAHRAFRLLTPTTIGTSLFLRNIGSPSISVGLLGLFVTTWLIIYFHSGKIQKKPRPDLTITLASLFSLLILFRSPSERGLLYIAGQCAIFLSILAFAYLFSKTATLSHPRKVIEDLLTGLNILFILNIISIFLPPAHTTASQLEVQNQMNFITGERTYFYFMQSGQELSAIAIAALLMAINTPKTISRKLRITSILLALTIVLAWGARGSVFFGIAAQLLILALDKNSARLRLPIVLTPLIVVMLSGMIYGLLPSSWVQSIDRYGMGMILSGREVIWGSMGLHLSNSLNDLGHLIFGYGLFGQVESGVYKYYAHLFDNYDEASIPSLHNTFLQAMIDGGMLYLLVLIALLLKTINQKKFSNENKALLFSTIFLIIIGSVEALFSVLAALSLFILLLAYFVANSTQPAKIPATHINPV